MTGVYSEAAEALRALFGADHEFYAARMPLNCRALGLGLQGRSGAQDTLPCRLQSDRTKPTLTSRRVIAAQTLKVAIRDKRDALRELCTANGRQSPKDASRHMMGLSDSGGIRIRSTVNNVPKLSELLVSPCMSL